MTAFDQSVSTVGNLTTDGGNSGFMGVFKRSRDSYLVALVCERTRVKSLIMFRSFDVTVQT